jgi:hypothetical protein
MLKLSGIAFLIPKTAKAIVAPQASIVKSGKQIVRKGNNPTA